MADNLRSRARERGVPTDWVELRHPESGGTHKCHPEAVSHWEDRGWVRAVQVAAKDKKAPVASARPAAGQEG